MRRPGPASLVILLSVSLVSMLLWQWWRDPERHFQRGLEALSGGERAAIENAAARLEGVPTHTAQQAFLLAALRLRDGEPKAAIELLQTCQDHPDVERDAHILAGEALYQLGAAGNAKLLWENALALDPESLEAHRWLGVLYFDLGAMDNAILHLQAVSRLAPNDHRPDRLMGQINRDYERPEVAIPHYEETLRRAPNQPNVETVWLELAECQIKQREYAAAVESLRNCSESPWQQRLLAECRMNLGDLDSARELAEKAVTAEPDNLDGLELRSRIALADGDVAGATELLSRGVEIDPFDYHARFQLSQVLARQKRTEEAEMHSKRADELQQLWARFSDLQIDAINQPTNADVRHEIAMLAEQLGKKELAQTWFQAALAIEPSHAQALAGLTKIEQEGGERDRPSSHPAAAPE